MRQTFPEGGSLCICKARIGATIYYVYNYIFCILYIVCYILVYYIVYCVAKRTF